MARWCMLLCLSMVCVLLLSGCGAGNEEKVSSAVASAPVSVPAPTPTAVPKAKAVKVTAEDGLNIRKEASEEGEILGLADTGSLLPLLKEEKQGDWYAIQYDGQPAYVHGDYVQMQEISMEEHQKLLGGAATAGDTSSSASVTSSANPTSSAAGGGPVSSGAVQGTPSPAPPDTAAKNTEDGEG